MNTQPHFESEKETKKLPQTPRIEKKIPERDFSKVPQKKSVFLLWIFSIITLGIYPAVWYLKRAREFYNLGTQKKLSTNLPMALLILAIIYIGIILTFPLTITEEMGIFYRYFSPLQSILLVILITSLFLSVLLSLILAFVSMAIINEAIFENKGRSTKIPWFFTLIFGFLYLQYEINRIIDDKEDTPRKGPWIIFILILILICLGILAPLVGISFLGV